MKDIFAVRNAFEPCYVNRGLTPTGRQRVLNLEMYFRDLAVEIENNVPNSDKRTVALKQLLQAKFACIEAVTSDKELCIQAASVVAKPAEKEAAKPKEKSNGKKDKRKAS